MTTAQTHGSIGYGMLGLGVPGRVPNDEDAIAAMKTALESGCTVWNGGEFYGPPNRNSLYFLNKYFEKYPEDANKVLINIKGATKNYEPDNSPEYIAESVNTCVRALGPKGKIDMFECARVDPKVPVKQQIATLAGLVEQGLIGGVAMSECNAESIRKAASVTKILAVEVELSLWNTDPLDNGVAAVCHEFGIPIHAYSPLGRGFLSGEIRSFDDLPQGDFRRMQPKYQGDNFAKNMKLVTKVKQLADTKGCSTSQLAINWCRALSARPGMPTIVPIPGSINPKRIKENATIVHLSDADMDAIDEILAGFTPAGSPYPEGFMKYTQR